MKKLRYGIIGFGTQGKTYCDILTGQPMAPGFPMAGIPEHGCLTAVSTSDPQKAEGIRQRYPGVLVFTDWKELIRSGTCDAVIPTVPHYFHHEIAIYAMEQGISVLSEKPLGVRASQVRQMVDCAQNHPEAAFGVFFNQRANKLYQKVKKLVSSGELGQIRRSNWIINTWWRPDSYYRQSPWRGTWAGEGGGVLVNQAPHQLDLWLWICGVPCEVMSLNLCGAHRDIAVENDVTLVTRYKNGSTGCFITCTHDPIGTDRLEIDLSKGKIVVENSKTATIYRLNQSEEEMNASLSMQEAAMLTRSNGAGGGLYTVEAFESSDLWGCQHSMVIENFALHCLEGTPLLAPGAEGLLSVQLANASQLSAWQKHAVSFPCDEAAFNRELDQRIAAEGR